MRQKLKIGLALIVLTVIGSTMIYSLNAGNILPFKIFPEEQGDHDGDHQYPSIEGSIAVNDDQENQLNDLSEISQSDAEELALAYTTGGTIISSDLENENGYLVWNVKIDFEGIFYDILVDAGNGKILWASTEGND